MNSKSDTSTQPHEQRYSLKTYQKSTFEGTAAHTKPMGYLETIVILMDECRHLLKSAQHTNDVLVKRNASLQAEIVALSQREAPTIRIQMSLPRHYVPGSRHLTALTPAYFYQHP